MSQQRVRYHLRRDPAITSLPAAELSAILRAADPLIAVGGRSLLTKILRGSRSKDVLAHGHDDNPAYGFFAGLPEEKVIAKIDWTILHRYLRIEYSGRLPVLVYTAEGWAIEREIYAEELIAGFDTLLASMQRPYDMLFLRDKNRELILRVLEKIAQSGDARYVPVLEDWALIDYKKIKKEIRAVIHTLTGPPSQNMAPGPARAATPTG